MDSRMTAPLIQLQSVSLSFEGHAVLQSVDLTIQPTSAVVIIGVSGSGKTTLLRLLHHELRPDSGTVSAAAADQSAILTQGFPLYPHLKAVDQVVLALRRGESLLDRWSDSTTARQEALSLLADVGLADYAARRPHQLSGGQRQRVAIAIALAMKRRLLLLDEPFSALDDPTRDELQTLLISLRESKGIGWVLVTHDLVEALFLGQSIYALTRLPGTTACTLRLCPVNTPLTPTPAVKSDPAFLRTVDALRSWLTDGVPLPTGLRRTLIRESDLAEIEATRQHIVVISPHLANDLGHAAISDSVTANLAAGKRYTYVYPAGNPTAEANAATLATHFAKFVPQVQFHAHDPEDPVFLFGEIVIYDPGTPACEGYTYLGGDSAMLMAVPPGFVEGYLAILAKRGLFSRIPLS